MRLVHLSDTHFGTEIDAVVRAVIQTTNALEPDIVILSGDITQRARPSQFHAALDFMLQLSAPKKITVPGNHDIPLYTMTRFMWPYRNYCQAFGDREQIFNYKNVTLIGLDATSPYRHTDGKLVDRHDAYIKESLKLSNQDNQIRIVICHQPLVTAWQKDAREVLIHAQRSAELLSAHRIDLFLSGHVHVPILDTTTTAFPKLDRNFVLGGAGTATSWRTRPGVPNSFNVIDIDQNLSGLTIKISRYDHAISSHLFEPNEQAVFTKNSSSGWIKL